MHRIAFILGLLSLAVGAVGASAGREPASDPFDPNLSPAERLEAVAERVRRAHESLETLEAEFSQVKESALLVEPERATGQFSFSAPDKVRWEYVTPEPISLVIVDRKMTTWYRDIGQVETARVGAQADRVLRYLGAGTSLDSLREYFQVALQLSTAEGQPLKLKLSPRFERVARRIREMELWLDPKLYLPVRLRYTEGDGDVTEYSFSGFRQNEGIPAGRFELEWPEGVDVREVLLDNRAGAR